MTDQSYEAGYRAGHLQGWLDAMARFGTERPVVPGNAEAANGGHTGGSAHVPSAFPAPDAASPFRTPASPRVPVPQMTQGTTTSPSPMPPSPGLSRQAAVVNQYPVETPAERQARKEKRDRENINITLYVASLLLVAAGALFIGTNLPPVFRFAAVCAVTAMFYGAGFVLHARVPRLRPAAVAFAGTGLALVPVTGLALYNFALHDGPAAWLITSLVGTAAYMAAAARLESRVLVYLSFTFLASTACSGVSVLGGPLVWYFAALIGVAVLLTALAMSRPGWLPPVYIRPLMIFHPWVAPAVAIAVTCIPLLLDKSEYALIMGMCGAYFALTTALPGPLRLLNFYAARISLTVAAAVEIWHLTGRGVDAVLAGAVLLAAQAVATALSNGTLRRWFPEVGRQPEAGGTHADAGTRWRADALATFAAQLVVTAAFAAERAWTEDHGEVLAASAGAVPVWVPVLLAVVAGLVLAAKLAGEAEWAPVAALTLAAALGDSMGAWPLAGMLLLGSAFWTVRGLLAEGRLRQRMFLAARVASTVAVPVTVAAVVGDGAGQTAAALFGLLVALVSQQLLTAVLQRSGVRMIAAQASLGGFAAASVASLISLPFLDSTPGHGLTGLAVLIQLVAALAVGWLQAPRPGSGRDWHATVWEGLPLGVAAVAVPVAFGAVSQSSGNMALLLVAGYLFAKSASLKLSPHRWAYWWLGRGTVTLLAVTAFDQLQQDAGPTVFAGEVLLGATVLVTVLALQLVFPLAAAARVRAPKGILADAGIVLLLQLASCAVLAPLEAAEWQGTYTAVAVAVGAAASGYVLRAEAGSVWIAPVAFGALLAFSGGDLAEVELLIGVFAVFCAVMVVAQPHAAGKGWYFVAARMLTASLAVVLSYDITASPTAVSLTFAFVLAAQHAVRWALRSRLADVPFQQAAVWITLAGQALLPLAYMLHTVPAGILGQDDDGGRWVVLLELLLLLVSALAARRLFGARGALYFAVYAALVGVVSLGPLVRFGGTLLAAPVLNHTGTATVLLVVALLAAVSGALRRGRNVPVGDIEHWLWLGTAGSFTLAGLLVSPLAADWIQGAAVLVLAGVCFTASHVEGQTLFYPPAAAAGLAGSMVLAADFLPDIPGSWGEFLPWLTGAGLAACALYSARLYRSRRLEGDPVRRWSLAGAAFLGFCLAALSGIQHDATAWAATALLAAAVGIAYLEAPRRVRRVAAEIGALALTAAIQRAAIFELDRQFAYNYRLFASLPDPFWVAQWYVLLAAGLGASRYAAGHRLAGKSMVAAGGVLLSLSGLGVVFGGTGAQQLWVLVLLALLLLAGLGLSDRLFVWWGAAGVAACILWAMRQYTFALLALIAVGLIVVAVWRLNRGTGTESALEQTGPEHPVQGGPAEQDPIHRH
ncbi:hypothetical protein QFZ40_000919 [Arthrobacter pascens]|uniref:hypothetical protein n=1 Tax=Arthrobacter pascens TaxID=1677 RepID=UPI00278A8594|nr:hypothetical protein [Arthrobacter pascens]MDQ0633010.1 hypothetical protein [Arthrobacter pascens]